ncbi:MAG TPA: L17 family ribosomal protein [Candidatus Dojkabacteria bacterium]|jgi:large subunit ribosomal protein L17|nr:L17 family ribosomal protein [Candidatus Dojkabacteria bacterium]
MYKRVKKAKLGRTQSHRNSLRRNLLRSLFTHNSVVTTSPKAKVLKQDASSLIAKGISKGQSLEFRRELGDILGSDVAVKKFYEYIKKEGVGVVITKVGFRSGDNAEKSRVILKGTEKKKVVKKDKNVEEKKKIVTKIGKNTNLKDEKRIDKTAVVKKEQRANTRSGL